MPFLVLHPNNSWFIKLNPLRQASIIFDSSTLHDLFMVPSNLVTQLNSVVNMLRAISNFMAHMIV